MNPQLRDCFNGGSIAHNCVKKSTSSIDNVYFQIIRLVCRIRDTLFYSMRAESDSREGLLLSELSRLIEPPYDEYLAMRYRDSWPIDEKQSLSPSSGHISNEDIRKITPPSSPSCETKQTSRCNLLPKGASEVCTIHSHSSNSLTL